MAEPVQARPFGVRFDEAIANLKGKLPEASVAWNSLAGPVHGKVFTVAGATTADLARDIQQHLVTSLAEGQTITQFRKGFDVAVQKHGWTYKGKRGWRTNVIFNTNMRSAHMAGRWAQIEANVEHRPYLQYRTAGDARVRPQHRQWNGLIYPVSDSFWNTHYPPNGWNCRCAVRAYSQGDMAGKNLRASEPFDLKYRDVLDREGQITDRVPVGIDPGWDHNVGQSWITPELALGRKLAALPRELQGLITDKTISPAYQTALAARWKGFREGVAAGTQAAGSAQVLGFLDTATLDGLAAHVPELQVQSTAMLAFADQAAAITTDATASAGWPADWVAGLPTELRNYHAVLWDRQTQQLVVVPQGRLPGPAGLSPQVLLKPNARSEFGVAFSVQALGSVDLATLHDGPRFKLLSGSVTKK